MKATDNKYGKYIDPRDGNEYRTVKIGDQVWLAENLRYLPGDLAGVFVYGFESIDIKSAKSITNYQDFGALYNWDAALSSCPPGWHLPSEQEWQELEKHMGMTVNEVEAIWPRDLGNIGQQLKSPGWDGDQDGNLDVLPGGYRKIKGKYVHQWDQAVFWSSSSDNLSEAWYRMLNTGSGRIARDKARKELGFSVRAIKDSTDLPGQMRWDVDYFVDPRDGNRYKQIIIGNQTWMAENLRYIPHVSPVKQQGGIWVYNYDGSNVLSAVQTPEYKQHGCLYDSDNALIVSPPGWHLPGDDEWNELEHYLNTHPVNNQGKIQAGFNMAGDLLKSKTMGGTNFFGFNALPAGERNTGFGFDNIGEEANFRTRPVHKWANALCRRMTRDSSDIGTFSVSRSTGYSVRCIKDKVR